MLLPKAQLRVAKGLWETMLLPTQQKACTKFFLWVFAWSKNRLYHNASAIPNNAPPNPKATSILAWFLNFKKTLDVMPDRVEYQVAVPAKHVVHTMYMDDSVAHPLVFPACTRRYFLKLWLQYFDNIKVRKWNRFTRCDFCEKQRTIQHSQRSSVFQKQKAILELVDHYKFIAMERAYAESKKARALTSPNEILSLAIDGTDQLPNGLPQFSRSTSSDAGAYHRLMYKMTICRIHGIETTCYTHRENIPGNPNLTIEILQRAMKIAEKRLGRLPDIFHVQFDNCWRENKNSYVLAYLADLVHRGLFPLGAHVSFLPRGHTHNEVDQVASRISVQLRGRDITTRKQMEDLVAKACDNLKVVQLHRIANTKELLNPGLSPTWANSPFFHHRGISTSRYFRITLNCAKQLEVRTKLTARDEFWSAPWLPTRPGYTGLPWSVHPGVDFSVPDDDKKALIDSHLLKCRSRVCDEDWDLLMQERKMLDVERDSGFDWEANGTFTQEHKETSFLTQMPPSRRGLREAAQDELAQGRGLAAPHPRTGDDIRQWHHERHPHLFAHGTQLDRQRGQYDAERPYLEVGALLVVLSSTHERYHAIPLPPGLTACPQTPFGFAVCKVTRLHASGCVDAAMVTYSNTPNGGQLRPGTEPHAEHSSRG